MNSGQIKDQIQGLRFAYIADAEQAAAIWTRRLGVQVGWQTYGLGLIRLIIR